MSPIVRREFVIRGDFDEVRRLSELEEPVQLSASESLQVLDLLTNPPAPNARLQDAARQLVSLE